MMFFAIYLRRELRRRMRQAVFVALGLAVGVGLVVTVSAASAGVKSAEADVLKSLYGVGTDVTVTGPAPAPKATGPSGPNTGSGKGGQKSSLQIGPNGAEICTNGKCVSAAGKTFDEINALYTPFTSAEVPSVARLRSVVAVADGLLLTDNRVTIPDDFGQASGSAVPTPTSLSVDGVDVRHTSLGPLSAGTITSGHSFSDSDSDSDVAVVDSGYATSNSLKVGSVMTIDNVTFTVIGLVRQGQTTSPNDVYIPLGAAQALQIPGTSGFTGEVNAIYVTAASAAAIPAVQHEIAGLLPHDTVTTAASLASEVTGSVSEAARLAGDLGKWLAVLVLIAAFAVASLLTMSAVTRRVAEFGTLKAIGWRTRRIVAQVLGESLVMGVVGAAVGVGLGFAGAAIITKAAPKLDAVVPGSSGLGTFQTQSAGSGPASQSIGGASSHTIAVPLHPSITPGVIVVAVILAVGGALLAGSFGSWRIAKLRPADALSRVA
jgi:putative ABC transport system permease protein